MSFFSRLIEIVCPCPCCSEKEDDVLLEIVIAREDLEEVVVE
jgi:hypothetical protein